MPAASSQDHSLSPISEDVSDFSTVGLFLGADGTLATMAIVVAQWKRTRLLIKSCGGLNPDRPWAFFSLLKLDPHLVATRCQVPTKHD